jgi:EmrB/QacA subfamily drug resistance transporter
VTAATAPATTAPAIAPPPALTQREIRFIFGGLVLAMLLAALDSTIVATALPTIVGELGGLSHLSWVVTAYLLAQTVVTPLYGKLGDLYGRKGILQIGIVVFLVGSALCGVAQTMTQLIAFRFLQGLGGGGLAVTTMAVVGDIIPPRERGRYQGIFGAAFGVASVAGPLLGGFFTSQLSWRWIFYVNLPLGAIALTVLAVTLPSVATRVRRSIDYAGSALLALVLAAIVLVTDLGGAVLPWSSPPVLALAALAVVCLALFVAVERRAAEPVLPLRLFANRSFTVAAAVGLIVGFALFGSVTYLPVFLQVVKGASPTASGLQMIAMMGGMLVTSIGSGQFISRTGRYRVFPIVGTAVMTAGLFLLSRMGPATTVTTAMGTMLVLGLGLGMVMQVLVIAVQNAVDYADLGVATSGATLFRLIGGSLGTAALGALFATQLSATLERTIPAGTPGLPAASAIDVETLAALRPGLRALYVQAFASSFSTIFLVATAIALLGFLLAWFLPERPLRETIAAASTREMGEAFAMPADTESSDELLRGLSVLADRDVQRRYIEGIVARAGETLSAAAAWLLVRLERDPTLDVERLRRAHAVRPERLHDALVELRLRELVVEECAPDGVVARRTLTAAGREVCGRLVDARRARLSELFGDWPPERREEMAVILTRLARELVPEVTAEHPVVRAETAASTPA